jgi:hypothetical protein
MLRHGDELWDELRAALDASIDQALGPLSDWTGHDVYAHFARWQAHAVGVVRRLIAGEKPVPVPGDENVINERWAAEDRALPHEVVRERCLATRQELRTLLEGLSAAQLDRFGRRCSLDISGEHYARHLSAIGGGDAAL